MKTSQKIKKAILAVLGIIFVLMPAISLAQTQNPDQLQSKPGNYINLNEVPTVNGTSPTAPPQAPEGEGKITKPNWLNCILSAPTCAIFYVSLAISGIGGLIVALGAWMTDVALVFSSTVVESPAVKIGFNVTLALANLGFVLAIIIIAIMTILRRETYGVKQLLWKLVLAAVLVNFSLTIAGTILNFSDSLTNYFVNQASPSYSGKGPDYAGFVTGLTNAFKPQILFGKADPKESVAAWRGYAGDVSGGCAIGAGVGALAGGIGAAPGCVVGAVIGLATQFFLGGDKFDEFMQSVLNLVFIIIFTFLIAFTFIAIAIMFFIRYAYLSILLILMPLAWLLWIFPIYASSWSKWWNNFMRWAFFGPICIFFLYLVVAIAQQHSYLDTYASDAQRVYATKNAALGVGEIIQQGPVYLQKVGEMIVLLALALGGLFAANSLSITFAKEAYGAAKGGVKGIGGWAARKGSIPFTTAGARLARGIAGRIPAKPPPVPYTGWKSVFNPARRFAYGVRTAPARSAGKLQNWATAAQNSPGWFKSVGTGMAVGSGIRYFQKAKTWTCQNPGCPALGGPGVIKSKGKPAPDDACPHCGETTNNMRIHPGILPTYENWK